MAEVVEEDSVLPGYQHPPFLKFVPSVLLVYGKLIWNTFFEWEIVELDCF